MNIYKITRLIALLMAIIAAALLSGNVIACSPDKPEQFDLFVKQFMSNKGFSIARTLYPYTQTVKTEDQEEKRVVTKSDDEKYPPLTEFIAKNKMAFGLEDIAGRRATLRIYAPNTGYSIRYNYVMRRGCWFLESTHVVSI